MKTTTLLAALALACGSAFAAGNTTDHTTTPRDQGAAVSSGTHDDGAKGEGFVTKTKRAFHRMGDKLRSMTHKGETQEAKDGSNDTRAMGAAGSDTTKDGTRKQRMDQAYSDYQSKQKK